MPSVCQSMLVTGRRSEGSLNTAQLCLSNGCGLMQNEKCCLGCWWQTFGCAANAQIIQNAVEETMSISAYRIAAASHKADLCIGRIQKGAFLPTDALSLPA